jgi:hypothetical protein
MTKKTTKTRKISKVRRAVAEYFSKPQRRCPKGLCPVATVLAHKTGKTIPKSAERRGELSSTLLPKNSAPFITWIDRYTDWVYGEDEAWDKLKPSEIRDIALYGRNSKTYRAAADNARIEYEAVYGEGSFRY